MSRVQISCFFFLALAFFLSIILNEIEREPYLLPEQKSTYYVNIVKCFFFFLVYRFLSNKLIMH